MDKDEAERQVAELESLVEGLSKVRKWMTHDERLRLDRMLYGSSFERVDRDGTRHRLDPMDVTVKIRDK